MKKWLKRLGVLLILGYILFCIALYFGQDVMLFHPHPLAQDHVYEFQGAESEEFFVHAEDSTAINALIVKSQTDTCKGVVLFSHGNTGNIQACGHHHQFFTERGFDFVVWDYRTYGKTGGERTEETFYSDALTIYDWVAKQYGEEKVLVYGQSLGSGIGVYMAANRSPHSLLLEAPYLSIQDLAMRRFPIVPGFICRFPLRSDLHIPKVKCTTYGFHGTDDQTIYWQSSEKLAALNEKFRFFKLEGVSHNGIPKTDKFQEIVGQLLSTF